ncbi:hypothetical protein NIES4103_65160 [Nostoc sp. NIES-4103]|nr:hypothetical protein NIES4103_65160 [Nostoc sp. NIES-4103]
MNCPYTVQFYRCMFSKKLYYNYLIIASFKAKIKFAFSFEIFVRFPISRIKLLHCQQNGFSNSHLPFLLLKVAMLLMLGVKLNCGGDSQW